MTKKPVNVVIGIMIFIDAIIIIGSIIILIKFPNEWIKVFLMDSVALISIGVIIRIINKREVINNTLIERNLIWIIWIGILSVIPLLLIFVAIIVLFLFL
jgi:hypothetical protein